MTATTPKPYAFIHIPKTAGSTMRDILRRSFGSQHCDVRVPLTERENHTWVQPADIRRARRVYPHLAGICGHRVTSFSALHDALPGLRFFTWLRDPVARFLSHFHHHHRDRTKQITPESLAAFCDDAHQHNVQTRWLCGTADSEAAILAIKNRVEFVGVTEHFDTSLLMFARWLDRPGFKPGYVPRNVARRKAEWSLTDHPELERRVHAVNAADIRLYAHVLANVYPRQQALYGPDLEQDVAAFRTRNAAFTYEREPLWGRAKRNLIYKPALHIGLC